MELEAGKRLGEYKKNKLNEKMQTSYKEDH